MAASKPSNRRRRYLVYTRCTELLRIPVEGGPWTRVTTQTIRPGWWSVAQNGIYFAAIRLPKADVHDEAFPVLLVDPQSGQTRQAATIPGPVYRSTPDFTTSADGKMLYYCALEVSTSQIRMVESS
jgi:hypothetical protein